MPELPEVESIRLQLEKYLVGSPRGGALRGHKITEVEAMAVGTPVIALRSGGVIETIIDGKTGVFFDEPTVESLTKAIKRFEKMKINPEDCIRQAKKFSKERFKREFKNYVYSKVKKQR